MSRLCKAADLLFLNRAKGQKVILVGYFARSGATIELTMHPLESVLVDSGSNAVQIEVLIATT